MKDLGEKGKDLYVLANRNTRCIFRIIRNALVRLKKLRGSQAAAGMAYYAFFSLFPILLLFIVAGSYFLEGKQVQQYVLSLFSQAIPNSSEVIRRNIDRVLELRGTVGVIGAIGLLWSATGGFSALAFNINLAWPDAEKRNFLEKRLVGLGMVSFLAGLLVLSILVSALGNLLPRLNVFLGLNINLYNTSIWEVSTSLIPPMLIFLMFFCLYLWTPTIPISKRAAAWSALFASVAMILISKGFTWYLNMGLGRYELVYGSLGTVVALMFLIYLSLVATLFGAHLCAAIMDHEIEQN